MTEQPFSDFAVPRQVPADVVPKYAFERAMDVVNGLMVSYTGLASAFAEAVPDRAEEVGTQLAEVLNSVSVALEGIGTPPR